VGGCCTNEDVNHLFMRFNFFGPIFVTMNPTHISDHFLQFGQLRGLTKNHRSAIHLLWLSCIWVIWNEKNGQIFKQKEHSLNQLLEKIKLQTFWWLKAK